MKKPRKKYRPGPVHCNALSIVLNKVRKLSAEDQQRQRDIMTTALQEFAAGRDCAYHWRSLADAANMTETLAGMGICSGLQAETIIHAAQQALAAVQGRHAARGTWTMYATELDTLHWMLRLHTTQLAECDYGEFERAYQTTCNRIAQARAGNAPADAVVIVGDVAARREPACAASAATSP
jgi:hypothetical protein